MKISEIHSNVKFRLTTSEELMEIVWIRLHETTAKIRSVSNKKRTWLVPINIEVIPEEGISQEQADSTLMELQTREEALSFPGGTEADYMRWAHRELDKVKLGVAEDLQKVKGHEAWEHSEANTGSYDTQVLKMWAEQNKNDTSIAEANERMEKAVMKRLEELSATGKTTWTVPVSSIAESSTNWMRAYLNIEAEMKLLEAKVLQWYSMTKDENYKVYMDIKIQK